jgi:alpha-tubulin suppressor-like RCC1 family protein
VICWRSTDPNPQNTQDYGQCGPLHKKLTDIVAISAGKQYSLALDKYGKVYAWGRNDYRQAVVPKLNKVASVIEAGYVNSVIGYTDTSVRAFGEAMHGALVSRTPTRPARRSMYTVPSPTANP